MTTNDIGEKKKNVSREIATERNHWKKNEKDEKDEKDEQDMEKRAIIRFRMFALRFVHPDLTDEPSHNIEHPMDHEMISFKSALTALQRSAEHNFLVSIFCVCDLPALALAGYYERVQWKS